MILFSAFKVKAASLLCRLIFASRHFATKSGRIPLSSPMSQKQIVLASTSPFRRELLSRLRLPFDVASPDVDESSLPGESPESTALRLSEAKARAVAGQFPQALIIGSDQVAFLNGQVFGKPGTHEKAVAQLQYMSGRTVNFLTGLCLLNAWTDKIQLAGISTLVTFRDLTHDEIENYLRSERPYNCAGSAKSEGLGIALIGKMVGDDPNALIGLPLIELCGFLRNEGIKII